MSNYFAGRARAYRVLAGLIVLITIVMGCWATGTDLWARCGARADVGPPAQYTASVPFDPLSPWVSVRVSSRLPRWQLVNYVYRDEHESGGSVNIYITVVDRVGAPMSGIRAMQCWPDSCAPGITRAGAVDFPQSGDSSFSPARGEVGPYWVYVEGEDRSDVVSGMGLPLRRHVSYYLTFRWLDEVTAPPATVTPVPPVTSTPPTGTPIGNAEVLRIISRALRLAAEEIERGATGIR